MGTEKRNEQIKQFKQTVLTFYKSHARTFPWRETRDPYKILVSEIMLQQTQAARVVEKYTAFIKAFPTVQKLAQATDKEVLALWSGLGYNRRGLFLKRAAIEVLERYKGHLPQEPELLEELPGVGKYTARAILAFAFNKPVVFIETNIRTAYITFFFPHTKKVIADQMLTPLIEQTLDKKNPHRWYSAVFDYGAYLKQSGNKVHRKSSTYKKQSIFKGSVREIRGMILRALLEKSHTKQSLVKTIKKTEPEIVAVLEALMKEKIITKIKTSYTIN